MIEAHCNESNVEAFSYRVDTMEINNLDHEYQYLGIDSSDDDVNDDDDDDINDDDDDDVVNDDDSDDSNYKVYDDDHIDEER